MLAKMMMLALAMASAGSSGSASSAAGDGAVAQDDATSPPYWAFPVPSTPVTALTAAQEAALFEAVDLHPDAHPAMPDFVAHGRKPELYACAYCHLPNGLGRPENASLAGLPADYIERQVADFRSGMRRGSQDARLPPKLMIHVAQAASTDEVRAAAAYYSKLPRLAWIRVVETQAVPSTQFSGWMLVPSASGGTEPIGERIIETPEDPERTRARDDTHGFIAWVPPGSIAKGAELVRTGAGGRSFQCTACHGPQLRGMGSAPPLSGRSPSYIVRQLYDFQHGGRGGVNAQLMKTVVAQLTPADCVALAAYVASLPP